jgi:hypothetical protein
MAKQADPVLTPAAVLKTARARAATNATTCRAELLAILQEQQGTAHFDTVYKTYVRYHTGEGVDDWYAERLAPPPGK